MEKRLRKKEFYFPSTNKADQIHAVVWLPDAINYPSPRGVVQIAHGMVEYIERYDELARYLNKKGFVVAGNDHLGHGKSVKSQEGWGYFAPAAGSVYVVADMHRLSGILKKQFPGQFFCLLGHSMGSFMVRRYMMTYGRELDGAILLGTGNQPVGLIIGGLLAAGVMRLWKGSRYRSKLLRRLMFGSYNRRIKNPRTDNDWVCSDEKIMEAYNQDPTCTFVFTVNGIEVLLKTLLFIENKINIEKIPKELPILMASGREDPVGNYGKAVKKVFRIYKDAGIKDIRLKLFDGCRHELHNEVIRQKVYAMLGNWLESKRNRFADAGSCLYEPSERRGDKCMWFDEAVVYQIYPLGMCGAPLQNDGVEEHRILRVLEWTEHIKKLGANCVLFNPLFESDAHGYDTRDYQKIDCRLGTKEDFKKVCDALHEAGIKVMLDGVFNHAGRGFWAFEDVRQKKWDSPYKDWFHISFDGNTNYNDGFWYEAWEGCNELVKLNLNNPAVRDYLFDAVRGWVRDYDIDGLRLDVAYCLDLGFLEALRRVADSLKPEFVLMGETLHGDYNRWMNDHACHSVTNYECYKGLYSSFNTGNMHEISYSLNRQFGAEQWCLYTGKHLFNFVDNHDVTRIATILSDRNCIRPIYGMLFGMPGVPAVYYGSEWGMEGDKRNGDPSLRPEVEKPETNELTEWIAKLAKARKASKALCYGSYRNVMVQPKQLIFERKVEGERVLVAINADGDTYHADFNAESGRGWDLISGEMHDFGGGSDLAPYSCSFWKTE